MTTEKPEDARSVPTTDEPSQAVKRTLYAVADELQEDAEAYRERNRGWTGEQKYAHQRKGQARGYEQAADRIRSALDDLEEGS